MLLNGAFAGSDVRAGSLRLFCGGDSQACLSRFLGLSSQGVWSLWKHAVPLLPVGHRCSESGGQREAGQGTAVGWVLRLVPVNRGRKRDRGFSRLGCKSHWNLLLWKLAPEWEQQCHGSAPKSVGGGLSFPPCSQWRSQVPVWQADLWNTTSPGMH